MISKDLLERLFLHCLLLPVSVNCVILDFCGKSIGIVAEHECALAV